MKTHSSILALAVATALGTLGALPAQALTMSYADTFTGTKSITNNTPPATATTGSLTGSTSFIQFDSNAGVLTGTTLQLTSTRTQTILGSGTDNTKSTNTASTTGAGTSKNIAITAPGASKTFGNLSKSGSCIATSGVGNDCSYGPINTSNNTNTTLTVSDETVLDSYVGTGNVSVDRSADLSVNSTNTNTRFTSTSSTYTLGWDGTLKLTYNYLLHAEPSFENSSTALTLNLDFGTVFLGDIPTLNFSIYNRRNGQPANSRADLSLDNIIGSGDTAQLETDLALFTDLGAGLPGLSYIATLDTSNAGSYSASYLLKFSDSEGAYSSRFSYEMTLNLKGQVIPEPDALALLGIGLLGLGFARRKT